MQCLKDNLGNLEQYERRDPIEVGGASLPSDANVVVITLRDTLKINIKEDNVSVAHRLGPNNQNKNRPILVKLVNRSIKNDLVGACIRLKLKIYIKESLTPKRHQIFKQVLQTRKTYTKKIPTISHQRWKNNNQTEKNPQSATPSRTRRRCWTFWINTRT